MLLFLDPPEVKEEQSIVFTAEGRETEIVCIVHAEPKADVSIYFKKESFKPYIRLTFMCYIFISNRSHA